MNKQIAVVLIDVGGVMKVGKTLSELNFVLYLVFCLELTHALSLTALGSFITGQKQGHCVACATRAAGKCVLLLSLFEEDLRFPLVSLEKIP